MSQRRASALVNVAAVQRNCRQLCSRLGAQTALCAVVKANGYGHGATQAAIAALAGGARCLAVAGSSEALALRDDGIQAPILVMGALSDLELAEALSVGAEVTVWHERFVERIAQLGGGRVHVKLDTGMGRLGTRSPDVATDAVRAAARASNVQLVGLMTHFATADDTTDEFMDEQLQRFTDWVGSVHLEYPGVIAHAANSAATLRDPRTHLDMVRCGVAIYGLDPFGVDPAAHDLDPALELRSYVAEVKRCAAGESAGYGRRFRAEKDTHLAVLPIGYGDGFRRAFSSNAEVLIDGRRRPLVGTVSMDNITVDLGEDERALQLVGAPAVLIGSCGSERITAEELAARIDTINYEITCGLTARVPRIHHRDGQTLEPAVANITI